MQEHLFDKRTCRKPTGAFINVHARFGAEQDAGFARSLATRHWGTHVRVPATLRAAAQHALQRACSTRHWEQVEQNNVANVFDVERRYEARNFRDHLAPVLAALEVPCVNEHEMAWLVCREVDFHLDESLADHAAFGVWHVLGAPRAVDFAGLGFGVTMQPGDALLFDGLQPHGVRHPSQGGQPFPACSAQPFSSRPESERKPDELAVFLSFCMPYTPALLQRMGMSKGPLTSTVLRFETNACTGVTTIRQHACQ